MARVRLRVRFLETDRSRRGRRALSDRPRLVVRRDEVDRIVVFSPKRRGFHAHSTGRDRGFAAKTDRRAACLCLDGSIVFLIRVGVVTMNLRNRIGLHGSYLLGVSGIGFALPYLPLYLSRQGLSAGAISMIWAVAALTSLAQFPVGVWSDRVGTRKPFLIAALGLVGASALLLSLGTIHNVVILSLLVLLFHENGIGRALVETLSGAEAIHLARRDEIASALGRLRIWKPIGVLLILGLGNVLTRYYDLRFVFIPIAILQLAGMALAFLIREPAADQSEAINHINDQESTDLDSDPSPATRGERSRFVSIWSDKTLLVFVVAMILFHFANAPGGVYLGLYLKNDLGAQEHMLSTAFVISMIAWMLVVRPAGRLADRWGRKPLLIVAWVGMALRLLIVAIARTPEQIVVNQALDGFSNGLFAIVAAAWVTDRLADPRRIGEAQVIVGSSLVLGSALGPFFCGFIVDAIGYRVLFGLLAAAGAVATLLIIACVPESIPAKTRRTESIASEADRSLADNIAALES